MTLRVPPVVLRLGLFLVLLGSLVACKKLPVAPVNKTSEGLAIKGYDPVAYFTDGHPVPGLGDDEYTWKGARWRFASAEHRAMFKLYPDRYAPQYGGYCAYAVSQGKTADIDPSAWTIVNNRLYLNLNKDVQTLWEKERDAYIRKADENWPHLLSGE